MAQNIPQSIPQLMAEMDNQIDSESKRFKEIVSQSVKECIKPLVIQNNNLKLELESLKEDNSELESLKLENETLRAEREETRKELREVRQENDNLMTELKAKDSVTQQAFEFAKAVLQNNHTNGIVNSMPEFSKQFVLSERPNSLSAITGSITRMNGLRLTSGNSVEEETTYHSTGDASNQISNSDDTYYEANTSNHSSVANGSDHVQTKDCQINQVSSTISPTPTNQTGNELMSCTTGSSSYALDENNNLKLKLAKVSTGRMISVTVAYVGSPSDFWLHLNHIEVENYIHEIQVRQHDLLQTPDCRLSSADIHLGMYCAAIYPSDNYWYRAQIIAIIYEDPIECDSVKTVRVLYIDWGNTAELPLTKIMKLCNNLSKRRQAVHCYIQGVHENNKWPQKIIDEFKDLIETKDNKLSATFVKCHKINERLDNVIYPTDLMIIFESGKTENLINFLPIPEICEDSDEPIEQNDYTFGTIASNAQHNRHSNKSLDPNEQNSGAKEKVVQLKSQSNQNCASTYTNSNGLSTVPKMPKSMPHLNIDLDRFKIPPPIVPDSAEGLIVEASHIESPSRFYVHINDPQVGSAQLENLEENLNTHYSDNELLQTQTPDVKVGSFWACRFSEDNRWYRVRVIKKIEPSKALLNYVDYGNEEILEINCLKQLTPQFANYPALAVKCSLSNIYPNGNQWSTNSSAYFAELVIDKVLTAFIGHKPQIFDFDSTLEVFLWTNDSSEPTAKDILINSNLVNNKYAMTNNYEWVKEAERAIREKTPEQVMSTLIPKIISANHNQMNGEQELSPIVSNTQQINGTNRVTILPELPSSEGSDDDQNWDPMAEDAYCDQNNYNVNHDNIGVITTGYQINDRKTCKFYETGRGCRLKDLCSFPHIDPNKRFEVNDTEEEFLDIAERDLEVGACYAIKVTHIQTPFSFFGVLPLGYRPIEQNYTLNEDEINRDLRVLSDRLKEVYSKRNLKSKENPNIYLGMGTLVAYKEVAKDTYYRGRIVANIEESNSYTIFSLDLGYEVEVDRKFVFKLSQFFNQFPALAVRCSLVNIEPINGISWSSEAYNAFREWTRNQTLCAHIMYGKTDEKFYVELIGFEDNREVLISHKLINERFAQRSVNYVEEDNYENGVEDESGFDSEH